MKKIGCLILTLGLLLLTACSRDMNWVISNEPSVRGFVEEIGEDYVLIRVTEADDPALVESGLVRAEKETRLQDCKFSAQVGDEVAVYYDDSEKYPAVPGSYPRIHDVHGYCLITPIEREADQ